MFAAVKPDGLRHRLCPGDACMHDGSINAGTNYVYMIYVTTATHNPSRMAAPARVGRPNIGPYKDISFIQKIGRKI